MSENAGRNFISLGEALSGEIRYLTELLGLSADWFSEGTMEERLETCERIRECSAADSAEHRFALLAPQYELYRYGWGVIRKSFPSERIADHEEDIEMVFMESILKGLKTYRKEPGAAGSYFGTLIHGAVFDYLNSGTGKRDPNDARALFSLSEIRNRLKSAGFDFISEGDYSLELNNTHRAGNRITRERLRYLIRVLEEGDDISIEELDDFADVTAGSTERADFRDPADLVTEKSLRKEISDCVFEEAEDERDAIAFLSLYYPESVPMRIGEILRTIYGDAIGREDLSRRMDRLMEKLRNDLYFMELLGKEELE